MKVNFNVYFKDFDGSVLLIDKKPQCMGVIVLSLIHISEPTRRS